MRKLGCLVVIGMLYAGGHGLWVGFRNRSPQTMTCAEAARTPPTADWVHLTGCRINLMDAVARESSSGEPRGDIYVPLRAAPKADTDNPRTARFVLATRDPAIVAVLTEMSALDANDKSAFYGFMAKNLDRMIIDRDVRGVVRGGLLNDDRVTTRLKHMKLELAPDFVVLNDGEEPSLLWPLTLLGGGVAAIVMLGVIGSVMRSVEKEAAGPPPGGPPPLPKA
jgi:hypothetical protein